MKDEKCKRALTELPNNLKNILKAPESSPYQWGLGENDDQ